VSYFGLDENERPGCQRSVSYHVIAGPGPTDGGGFAVITPVAAHDAAEGWGCGQDVHAVEAGGPAAALAAAIRCLDARHGQDHMRKVQSEVRGLWGARAGTVPPPE
jgi:hypothetical protein